MPRVGDAGHVVAVAEGEERAEREGGVLDGVDPAHEVAVPRLDGAAQLLGHLEPEGRGLEAGRRELEGLGREQILAVDAAPLVARDAGGDAHAAQEQTEVADGPRPLPGEDLGLLLRERAGVERHVDGAHAHAAPLHVELRHQELAAPVEVDRALVALGEDAADADRADLPGPLALGSVQHDRAARAGCAQVDVAVGTAARGEPLAPRLAPIQAPLLLELDDPGGAALLGEPGLAGAQGQLGGRAGQVRAGDLRIAGVEDRVLEAPGEEALGMGHQVLVEGVGTGDEGDEARPRPAHAPAALPARDLRARVADEDADVEISDVDAELEGGGGDHAQQASLEEGALDLAALARRGSPRGRP